MRRGHLLPVLILGLVLAARAQGHPIGPGLSLEKLSQESDLVVKVEAIGSEVVADPAFEPQGGYQVFASRLKVISVLKGDARLSEITFHHYDVDPKQGGFIDSPTVHHFTPKQSYLLFARATDRPTVFRTFSFAPTLTAYKELLRTANADPLPRDIAINDAVWRELKTLLAERDASNVAFAIEQLDQYSLARSPSGPASEDFPRRDVLDLIRPFLTDKDPVLAGAALEAIGRGSPYLSQNVHWLATVGKGNAFRRGYSTYPAGYTNRLPRDCRAQLVTLANSPAPPEVRGRAIRSLGLSRENEQDNALLAPLRAWSTDRAEQVRAAAAVLWADYPSQEATTMIQSLAGDQDPIVRAGAAEGIGCAQVTELVASLDTLLDDSDEGVSRAAAISLLSFDTRQATPILTAHLPDARYHVAFINELADADPAPFRDDLVTTLTAKTSGAEVALTGQVPSSAAWSILMTYVSTCDPAEIRAGKFDKYLDALETPPDIGSAPFQTLYGFYHDNGFADRMQSFRAKALMQVRSYDLDLYFKQIDGRK